MIGRQPLAKNPKRQLSRRTEPIAFSAIAKARQPAVWDALHCSINVACWDGTDGRIGSGVLDRPEASWALSPTIAGASGALFGWDGRGILVRYFHGGSASHLRAAALRALHASLGRTGPEAAISCGVNVIDRDVAQYVPICSVRWHGLPRF
jgi:hypothetical protein